MQNSWVIPYTGCINLEERPDRKELALQNFSLLAQELDFKVEWYHPKRDPEGGEVGCTRSHLKVIQKALWTEPYLGKEPSKALEQFKPSIPKYALVFEDDFEPTAMLPYIKEIRNFVENHPTWELLYLGGLPNIFRRRTKLVEHNPHCNIYRGSCILAHAYLISERYMRKLGNVDYIGIAIDRLFENCKEAYFVYQPLFRQNLSQTSIGEHGFASTRSKHFFIATQQWYATTVNFPIEIAAYAILGGILLSVLFILFLPEFWYLWVPAIIVLIIVFATILLPYYEN